MFMVALFLTHRAFRKDTVGAFLLCGLAVGILINIRILGVVLFAAVPALRALDLLFASREGRKHALITGGVFVLAAMFTLYATLPYLWANPIERTAEMFVRLSHQTVPGRVDNRKRSAAPITSQPWIAITTPPVALLLGVAGIIAVPRSRLGQSPGTSWATPT